MATFKIKKVSDKVEQILKTSTECRDSDMILWLAYCVNNHDLINVLGLDSYNKLKKFIRNYDIPNVESVGRARRKFQEQGMYLGTKQKEKKAKALKVQRELGYSV